MRGCMTPYQLMQMVRRTYSKLLPDVPPTTVKRAVEACYEHGMGPTELKKKTYSYLYPTNELTLW